MACDANNEISFLGGKITISVETLSAGLSVIAAFTYYALWKKDKNNIKDLVNDYMAMGEEYCDALINTQKHEIATLNYIEAFPELEPTGHHERQAYIDGMLEIADQHRKVLSATSADNTGRRCEFKTEAAKHMITATALSTTDAFIYERAVHDESIRDYIKANTDAATGTTPNIMGNLRTVGRTYMDSASANSAAFNSAMYVAGRSFSTMVSRGLLDRQPASNASFNATPPIHANGGNDAIFSFR